jgi:hypothetical protein
MAALATVVAGASAGIAASSPREYRITGPSDVSITCSCRPEPVSPWRTRSYQQSLRTLFMLPGMQPLMMSRSAARVIAT